MASATFFPTPTYRPNSALYAWLPVALFASIFALESTASLGTDHTSAPLHAICQFFLGASVNEHWSSLHHVIRKVGHFSGYGAFSLICFRGFWMSFRSIPTRLWRNLSSHGLSLMTVFLVATADEIHQTYLPNRTGTFSDVLLDTTGAACLQLALFLVLAGLTANATRRRAHFRQQLLTRRTEAALTPARKLTRAA
jgi:VanZ family protein